MKLHSDYGSTDGNMVAITAALAGTQLETPSFNASFIRNKDFAMKSAFKLLPALEVETGLICRGHSAMRLVAKAGGSALYPSDPVQAGVVDEWLEYSREFLEIPLSRWTGSVFTGLPLESSVLKSCQADARKFLSTVENRLKKSPFILGNDITLVDIAVACSLYWPFRSVLDEKYRKQTANVGKWFAKLSEMPEFAAVWGPPKLCKAALATPEPAAPRPKEEEKKAVEPAPQKPEKKLNPIDSLPESPFILDDWKRLYANTQDRFSVFPTFWEAFDKAGWSIWFIHYQKGEGEGDKLFKFANSLDGFLHRMENMRKVSFGTLGIYGNEPNLEIYGCMLWRGTGVFPDLEDHPQWEYYDREKADLESQDQRKKVEEHWGRINEGDSLDGQLMHEIRLWK